MDARPGTLPDVWAGAGRQDNRTETKPRRLTAALRPWLPLANLTDSTSLEPHLHHQPWPWSCPVPPGSLSTHPCAYTRGFPGGAPLRPAQVCHAFPSRGSQTSVLPGARTLCDLPAGLSRLTGFLEFLNHGQLISSTGPLTLMVLCSEQPPS